MRRLLLSLGFALLGALPLSAQTVVDLSLHCTADGKICVPKAPLKDKGIRYHASPPALAPVQAAAPAMTPPPPPPKPLAAPLPARPRQAAPAKAAPTVSGPPRVGQVAQNLRGFEQAKRSRFAPAPRGQEYWVVDDHLVLLRQSDRQIMAVLGPVDLLIK